MVKTPGCYREAPGSKPGAFSFKEHRTKNYFRWGVPNSRSFVRFGVRVFSSGKNAIICRDSEDFGCQTSTREIQHHRLRRLNGVFFKRCFRPHQFSSESLQLMAFLREQNAKHCTGLLHRRLHLKMEHHALMQAFCSGVLR